MSENESNEYAQEQEKIIVLCKNIIVMDIF